jgi:hypothetical protein
MKKVNMLTIGKCHTAFKLLMHFLFDEHVPGLERRESGAIFLWDTVAVAQFFGMKGFFLRNELQLLTQSNLIQNFHSERGAMYFYVASPQGLFSYARTFTYPDDGSLLALDKIRWEQLLNSKSYRSRTEQDPSRVKHCKHCGQPFKKKKFRTKREQELFNKSKENGTFIEDEEE